MLDAPHHPAPVEPQPTARDAHRIPCVHDLFEKQVARSPDAVALIFEDQSLTYQQLDTRANQLARYLSTLTDGPEARIGLCVERSLEMLVGLLAILKAGAAYVPLDPFLPPQRLAFLIHHSACPVVLTHSSLVPQLQALAPTKHPPRQWVTLDAILPEAPGIEDASPQASHEPHHLAYVLYTSGSTGQPKGVEMPHRALINLLQWQCANSSMRTGNRTLQFASLGFDVSFQEIFATWLTGGTLVIVTEATRKDPSALWATIAHWQIERVFLPYFVLERLAEASATLTSLPSKLQEFWVAGEQLRIGKDIRHCFQRMPHCQIWNQYGPTEAHVVTCYQLVGPPADWPDLPPIGQPLPHCQILLLDRHGVPVAAGEIGELHIGGVALARGYLDAPELTAERFIADPFSQDPTARLYKTGDLARCLPDGNIEFLGRSDDQVKIRGHRIELGEIEIALGQHPDIAACAVTSLSQSDGYTILQAFVVAREQVNLSARSLRHWLAVRLPEPMIPSRYFRLPAIPVTPNGKVDRSALTPQVAQELATGTHYVPAHSALECQLVDIWQRLFQRTGIGCHDNFFELGGHSMLAAQLVVEIDEQIGGKLPMVALFQAPTIAALAQQLTQSPQRLASQSLVPLQPHGSKPPIFFVHGWGGDVFAFVELAKSLGPTQPAYGIQAVGVDGHGRRHTDVESMAAHYVQEIRSFQPDGPYFLAGYSLGGLIAFEVAQHLKRHGQQVAMLALLDSEPPLGGIPWSACSKTLAHHLGERCVFHLRQWWSTPPEDRRAYVSRRWRSLRKLLVRTLQRPAVAITASPIGSSPPVVTGFNDYYHAVTSCYRLHHYSGKVDVFVSDESDRCGMLAWRHLVRGGAVFHRLACPHSDILAPTNVPLVARTLTQLLKRAQDTNRT